MIRPIAAAALIAVALAGCANPSATTYTRQDVGRVMESTPGTVVKARTVEIAGESSGLGAAATGIAAGTIGASTIGSGSGSVVAGALLGLVGVVVGTIAEEMLTSRTGVEYTVETADGRMLTVIQNAEDGEPLPPGTPVQVQFGGQYTRVIPDAPAAGPVTTAPEAPPPAAAAPAPGERAPGTGAPASGGRDWVNPDEVGSRPSTRGPSSAGGPDPAPSGGGATTDSTRALNIDQLRGRSVEPDGTGAAPRY